MDPDLMAPSLAYSPLAGTYLYSKGRYLGTSDLIVALKPLTGIRTRKRRGGPSCLPH